MVRVVQSQSPDVVSVSKYYSNELMKLVRDVLQIIPGSVFDTLGSIVNLLTNNLHMFPQKFDKAELSKYAQFEERMQMANLTYQISMFAEGVLTMESYLVGVVEVNPKEILEAGIKKELIVLIAKILDDELVFNLHTV
jgi:WASH complex subunit strumpellin